MTHRRGSLGARAVGLAAVLGALAVAPTAAMAAGPSATTSPAGTEPSAIIAILIGQVQARPFTPPIGTQHGS